MLNAWTLFTFRATITKHVAKENNMILMLKCWKHVSCAHSCFSIFPQHSCHVLWQGDNWLHKLCDSLYRPSTKSSKSHKPYFDAQDLIKDLYTTTNNNQPRRPMTKISKRKLYRELEGFLAPIQRQSCGINSQQNNEDMLPP